MRDQIVLACESCKRKNYRTSRNKKLSTDKLARNREKYPVQKAKGRATKYVDFD